MTVTFVDINALLEDIPGESPSGVDCGSSLEFQQLTTLAEYLGAKADQVELDRTTASEFAGENAESDRRAAEAFGADGRRRLAGLEEFVKEITGKAASPHSVQRAVESQSSALLQGSGKDLRIVQLLQLAWIGAHGLDGLQASLDLANSLLERFGHATHPRADDDAPDDFWAQANAVSAMLSGANAMAVFRQAGVFSAVAPGNWIVSNIETLELPENGAAGAANFVEEIKAVAASLVASQGAVAVDTVSDVAVSAYLDGRLQVVNSCSNAAKKLSARFGPGAVQGGDKILVPLGRLKKVIGFVLEGFANPPDEAAASASTSENPVESSNSRPARQSGVGALQSREDARKIILEVCNFLERTEPSHPAPYFLKRAERLLGAKDFFVILRDMAPDALAEIERITGHREAVQ